MLNSIVLSAILEKSLDFCVDLIKSSIKIFGLKFQKFNLKLIFGLKFNPDF